MIKWFLDKKMVITAFRKVNIELHKQIFAKTLAERGGYPHPLKKNHRAFS